MDLQDVGYGGGSLIGYETPGCSDGQYRYLSPTATGGYNSDQQQHFQTAARLMIEKMQDMYGVV